MHSKKTLMNDWGNSRSSLKGIQPCRGVKPRWIARYRHVYRLPREPLLSGKCQIMLWFAGPEGLWWHVGRGTSQRASQQVVLRPPTSNEAALPLQSRCPPTSAAFFFLRVFPHSFLSFFLFSLLSQHSLCLAVEIQKLLVFNLACWPLTVIKDFSVGIVWKGKKKKRSRGKDKERSKKDFWPRDNTQKSLHLKNLFSCGLCWSNFVIWSEAVIGKLKFHLLSFKSKEKIRLNLMKTENVSTKQHISKEFVWL